MAETQPYVPDDVSLSAERRVDAVCRRFEAEWQAGRRPDPEDFLAGWDGPERALLAHELALIDMDYRRQAGEATTASNYRRLFTPTPVTPTSTEVDEPLPRPFGRYELRRLLGRGGMGSVYLAHDAQLDRDVALKIPRPFGENPTLWRERFFTEARAAAALRHEHICPVHDVGEHDSQPFLTMAYIDGETLSARLKAVGRFPVAEAVATVAAVARAMAEAHAAGVVHRDLKPGNIMIDRRGRPVVMDFGLALRTSSADDLRVTLTGVALGTPAYMPPEQAGGDVDAIGPPADVYALGVILFELVTGGVPFRAKSFGKLLAQIERDPPPLPSSLNPEVPPALDALILTAMSKAPADRFPSAAEFADALDQFQAGNFEQLTSRYGAAVSRAEEDAMKTRAYPVPSRKRGRGLLVGLAAGFLGLLLLLAGAVFYVNTDYGDIKVELDGAEAKDVTVKVNGKEVVLTADGKVTTIRAGADQMLEVSGPDFKTKSRSFEVVRGKTTPVRVTLEPNDAAARRPDDKPKVEVKPDPKLEEKPKPKPVDFPKAKTLIEAGGWQILCDATKDEMQAWLDERKKAKHSVLWLDAYPVGDNPVFAAVAALDDRQPKWAAILAEPIHDFGENSEEFKRLIKTHRPVASASYPAEKQSRLAVLMHPGTSTWTVYGTMVRGDLNELEKNVSEHGYGYTTFRPHPGFRDTTTFATVIEPTAEGGKRAFDLSVEEVEKFAAEQRKAGTRVGSVCGYTTGGLLRFAAVSVANPNKTEWEVSTGLPADKLAEVAKEKANLGFRPDCVTAYPWDGAVRYCVVWVKDPPKPVPYPKEKTLVKAGDYETLLDATKEQMQAWLDEKKKAKQSVVWLDAIQVGKQPVFCAVAALDDRSADWTVLWDVPAKELSDIPSLKQRIATPTHWPRSIAGYSAEGKVVTVSLWRQGVKQYGIGGNLSQELLTDEVLPPLLKAGASPRILRPYSNGDDRILWTDLIELDPGAMSDFEWKLTPNELTTHLEKVRVKGRRPIMIAGYVQADTPAFSVITLLSEQKAEWDVTVDLQASKMAEAAKERAAKGFHPDCLTAYAWDGAVRYCVVWVKDPPKPVPYPKEKTLLSAGEYETLLDATKEQMQGWLDEKKKAKQSVLWLDVVAVAGKPLYSAVAALDDRVGDWVARTDEPAVSGDRASDDLKALVKDRRFVTLSGFPADGKLRSAFLLHPGKSEWTAKPSQVRDELPQVDADVTRNGNGYVVFRPYPGFRDVTTFAVVAEPMTAGGEKALDQTAAALDKFAADRRKAGHRVSMITAYPADGVLKFAAVSAANPDKQEWATDTLLTAAKLAEAAREKAKTGFRPASVTACPWDGAVRYCVVWVKDPPKPVKPPKEKTLIELPGWQLLADASKDDVEQWAAARKKDKHSVTWLAVTGVDGTPVYAGVAALDGRQTDWVVLPDLPAKGGQREVLKAIDPKRHGPDVLTGFVGESGNRFASLWTAGRHVNGYVTPDEKESEADERIKAAVKSESGIRSFHPFTFGKKALRYAFIIDDAVPDKNTALEWAVPAAELEAFVENQRKAGKQVTGAAPYLKDDALTYAVVTADNPDKREWEVTANLTAAQLKAAADTQSKAGRRPASVYALGWDGAVRYCVVWVKEEKKPGPKK